MKAKTKTIEQDVLAVLSAGACEGNKFRLSSGVLDRKLYTKVNEVLVALGGKWDKKSKTHIFAEDCTEILEDAIEMGTFERCMDDDLGWFPTPGEIVKMVFPLLDMQVGMHVLEPSAGEGAMAQYLDAFGAKVTCVEFEPGRAKKLESLGFHTHTGDFLAIAPDPSFDRVFMNPPFAKRADIHHVRHALKFLKPGGKLVAIMSGGLAFRQDKLTTEFRALCDSIEPLPAGAFAPSGTNVTTVVVTMSRPL